MRETGSVTFLGTVGEVAGGKEVELGKTDLPSRVATTTQMTAGSTPSGVPDSPIVDMTAGYVFAVPRATKQVTITVNANRLVVRAGIRRANEIMRLSEEW